MKIHPLDSRKSRARVALSGRPDEDFQQPPLSYAPWFFWFWNGPLDGRQIGAMAAEMCRQRINPGYVHARFHPHYPIDFWLSDAWFDAFDSALKATAEGGMQMTFTTGDPMMPHRLIVEKDPSLKAESLGWVVIDVPSGEEFAVPASFFTVAAKIDPARSGRIVSASLRLAGGGPAFSWAAPNEGSWRLYIFNKYLATSPAGAPMNFLDRNLGAAWIEVEHRKYDERYREYMGSTMPSIFIDHEGAYGYKIAWSEDLEKEFATKAGCSLRLSLPLLIEEDVEGSWGKIRWNWFNAVSDLYSECLIAPIQKWSAERGMKVTCHFWEENLYAQAMQVGSIFTAQRAYDLPGTDSLFLEVLKPREFKETQSVNLQAKVGQYVQISVADTGTGIAPTLLDKIFEPFFTTKAINKGTGLGLSTVMAIVKSHGGFINVYSEPNKGTTFKVYLPAMEMSSEARKEQLEQACLPRGNGEVILLVDDEASILTITTQTLLAFGYQVLTATDGAEAVAVYAERKNDIAVVLTDMAMPIMDGAATIRALTKMNPRLKIIAASGLHANADMTKASGVGIKHFLTKPYTAGTLLEAMRTILDEP